MSDVICTMHCPKCRKGYEVQDLQLQFFFIMEECNECNEEGKFVFKECIL